MILPVKEDPETGLSLRFSWVEPPDPADALALDWGDLEIQVGTQVHALGPPKGCLLILPTLETLGEAVLRLRGGHTLVEAALPGDLPSLWIREVRSRGRSLGFTLAFRDWVSSALPAPALDRAAEEGARAVLESLLERRPLAAWAPAPRAAREHLLAVWPALAAPRALRTP
ncbi:MAG: hypothetical protein HY823_15130 [Acidobacteria bacterium]|nr:hypothetical protein [Acidobacteriota bacterium]